MSKKLTPKTFNTIRQLLLTTNTKQADIAKNFNMGSSTVSLVNVYGTWNNFQARIKPPKTLKQRRTRALALAAKRALQPATTSPVEIEAQAAEQLAIDIDTLEKSMTRTEHKHDVAILSQRQDAVRIRLLAAERAARRSSNENVIAFIISAVALVLAIIALAN